MRLTGTQMRVILEAEAYQCACGGDGWITRSTRKQAPPTPGLFEPEPRRVSRSVRCPDCKNLWRLVEALGGPSYPPKPQRVSYWPRRRDVVLRRTSHSSRR